MAVPVRIREMRPGDEPQAEALWKGMSAYRPGDEAEVEAMHERAQRARDAGDRRWKAMGTSAPDEVVHDASASWVAVVPAEGGEERVVGTVQVIGPTPLPEMPPSLQLCREWCLGDDVAELKRLRVADDVRRQGVGTRLTQEVVEWCRARGFRTLVVNTTTPQKPAIGLYKRLGFREVERTFLDKYELVWLRLDL